MNFIKKFSWDKISSFVYPLAFGVIIFLLWENEILHIIFNTDSFILPIPSKILAIITANGEKMLTNAMATVKVAIPGLILGSILGYLVALVATFFKTYGVGGLSVVSIFNAIPIVALAPAIANWTTDVSSSAEVRSYVGKILVVMLMCTASMSVNAYRGLNELKPFSEDLMKSYACNKMTVLLKLRFPNSIPYIFIALRVSVPISVISTLVSEYFAEYITGVGRQIRENILIAQYASAWAYIAVACVIGVVMYGILMLVQGICLKNRKN
ncbi:MAG: ABC transporter permease subunit [Clostridia bacterium]